MSERNQAAGNLLKVAMNVTRQTQHDVFVDYSAHTQTLRVSIHMGGWKGKLENVRSIAILILEPNADRELELARRDIVNIAAEGKVDTEGTYLKWT